MEASAWMSNQERSALTQSSRPTIDLLNTTSEGTEIKNRFDDMIVNLPEPYARLMLLQVVTTATVLTFV